MSNNKGENTNNDDWNFIVFLTNRTNLAAGFVMTFLLVSGVISNVLNIIISSRKRMLKSTVGLYYIFISVFNILTVISGWIIFYPPAAGFINLELISGKIKVL